MRYSLINVWHEEDGLVDGNWIQDCSAVPFEVAVKRARETEKANSNRITVAVVEGIDDIPAIFAYKTGLKRLDR